MDDAHTNILAMFPYMVGSTRKRARPYLAAIELKPSVLDALDDGELELVKNDFMRRLSLIEQPNVYPNKGMVIQTVQSAIKELETSVGKHFPWIGELQVKVYKLDLPARNGSGK